jgi:polysaccharide biosynthesis protein PslH
MLFSRLDAVISISPVDTSLIRAQSPEARVFEMPAGYALNSPTVLRSKVSDDPRFCFIGSLDYTVNRDGLEWFIDDIWPEVLEAYPAARLVVAGKSAQPLSFLSEAPGVTYLGFVGDLDRVVADSDIAIVPLRVGGGIRLKILDFLSRGLPIVSTNIGAEGLPVEHDGVKVISLANTAEEFLHCVQTLVSQEGLREEIAAAGRRLIGERFEWKGFVAQYLQLVTAMRLQAGCNVVRSGNVTPF